MEPAARSSPQAPCIATQPVLGHEPTQVLPFLASALPLRSRYCAARAGPPRVLSPHTVCTITGDRCGTSAKLTTSPTDTAITAVPFIKILLSWIPRQRSAAAQDSTSAPFTTWTQPSFSARRYKATTPTTFPTQVFSSRIPGLTPPTVLHSTFIHDNDSTGGTVQLRYTDGR